MAKLQPVRGTHDLLPEDCAVHRLVESLAKETASLYGFKEAATPIFEFTEVFARTLGDTSDIVTKEMYTFEPKGGESVTLRPEGTAGIARAFLSNGLAQNVPVKLFYSGPMFRHERPQKGRQRQFHQVGIELIGAGSPQADVEVIALGAHILDALGLGNAVQLELNSLGDTASRAAYRDALVEFLSKYEADLSDESQTRLHKNPMRILDSKDEKDRAIVADAPSLPDYLNAESQTFIETVERLLEEIGVPFVRSPRLVRGLDYYCHTAFEFTTTELGAQGTVLAGGRYDGLIEQMGGPATPGVGWAAGIERLAMLTDQRPSDVQVFAVVPVSSATDVEANKIAQALRKAGFAADLAYSGNLKRRLKRADKINARAAVIVGEDEIKDGKVLLRDLKTGEQSPVSMTAIVDAIASAYPSET